MLESQLESLAISGETLSNLCQAYKCENLLRAMPEKSKKNESSQHNEHLWCRNWYLRCFQANTIPVWRCSLRPGFIEEGDGAMAEPRKVQRLPPSSHPNSNPLFFLSNLVWTHIKENYFSYLLGHKNLQGKRFLYDIQSTCSIIGSAADGCDRPVCSGPLLWALYARLPAIGPAVRQTFNWASRRVATLYNTKPDRPIAEN